MSQYTVTFKRIGRNHNVPPLQTGADDAEDLAAKVWRYARPHLGSRDIEVALQLSEDGAEGHGEIYAGFHSGGTFTITETNDPTEQEGTRQ